MDDQFLEAVRVLLLQVRSVDTNGLVNYIDESYFENLSHAYKRYCKKHYLKANRSHLPPLD